MYLAQYKANTMKCSESWCISTDVHFMVLSDLKRYEVINFQGPDRDFEGQNQCGTSKSTACAGRYGWYCTPEEYQSGWGISGHCQGMDTKIRWELEMCSAWMIDQKKQSSKTWVHFIRWRRDLTKHWTFWNSYSTAFQSNFCTNEVTMELCPFFVIIG